MSIDYFFAGSMYILSLWHGVYQHIKQISLKPVFGYGVRFSVDIGFDTVSLIIKEHGGFQCMLILLKLSICVEDTLDF